MFIISGGATTVPHDDTASPRARVTCARSCPARSRSCSRCCSSPAPGRSSRTSRGRRPPPPAQAPAPIVPLSDQQRADLEKWWLVAAGRQPPDPRRGLEGHHRRLQRFPVPALPIRARGLPRVVAKYAGNKPGPFPLQALSTRRGVQHQRAERQPFCRVRSGGRGRHGARHRQSRGDDRLALRQPDGAHAGIRSRGSQIRRRDRRLRRGLRAGARGSEDRLQPRAACSA